MSWWEQEFSSGANYSQGNLRLVTGGSSSARNLDRQAISSYTFNKGKWYAEIRYISGNLFAGFGPWQIMVNPESNNNKYVYVYHANGRRYIRTAGSESTAVHGASFTAGDIIGVFIDMDAPTPLAYFSKMDSGQMVLVQIIKLIQQLLQNLVVIFSMKMLIEIL